MSLLSNFKLLCFHDFLCSSCKILILYYSSCCTKNNTRKECNQASAGYCSQQMADRFSAPGPRILPKAAKFWWYRHGNGHNLMNVCMRTVFSCCSKLQLEYAHGPAGYLIFVRFFFYAVYTMSFKLPASMFPSVLQYLFFENQYLFGIIISFLYFGGCCRYSTFSICHTYRFCNIFSYDIHMLKTYWEVTRMPCGVNMC